MSTARRTAGGWLRPFPIFVALALLARLLIGWERKYFEIGFREPQTALCIYYFIRDGIDLLRPPLPIFGTQHPSIPLEFPLFQGLVALPFRLSGVTPALPVLMAAGRLASFFFFLATGWVVWKHLARASGTLPARIFAVYWLALPYPFFWGETCLIEFAATFLAVAYVLLLTEVPEAPRRRALWWFLVLASGTLAYLTKSTTVLCYLPSALVLFTVRRRALWASDRRRLLLEGAVALLVPFAVGYAWVVWSDHVKSENPIGWYFESGNLKHWTFGTLEQRLSAATWIRLLRRFGQEILPIAISPLVLVGALAAPDRGRTWLLWIAPVVTGLLVFTNLHLEHLHYQIAILPGLYVLAALGTEAALRFFFEPSRVALWGLAVLLPCVSGWAETARLYMPEFETYADLPRTQYGSLDYPSRELSVAAAVRAHTRPDDLVYAEGFDWASDIPFYSERRFIMLLDADSAEPDSARRRDIVARTRKLLDAEKVSLVVVRLPAYADSLAALSSASVVERVPGGIYGDVLLAVPRR